MRFSLIIIILIALLTDGFAYGGTEDEVMKYLINATKTATAVYKADGRLGLIGEIEKCYKDSKHNDFYCIYLDIAS